MNSGKAWKIRLFRSLWILICALIHFRTTLLTHSYNIYPKYCIPRFPLLNGAQYGNYRGPYVAKKLEGVGWGWVRGWAGEGSDRLFPPRINAPDGIY